MIGYRKKNEFHIPTNNELHPYKSTQTPADIFIAIMWKGPKPISST